MSYVRTQKKNISSKISKLKLIFLDKNENFNFPHKKN